MSVSTATAWRSTGPYDRRKAEEAFRGGCYDDRTVGHILDAAEAYSAEVQFNCGCLLGQCAVETGWFRFGGQVQPEQYNFGGLAATDDGAAGASFATPEEGVAAVLAHHGSYLFGSFDRWPVSWLWLQPLAIRNQQVLAAGYGGTVAFVGELGDGKWATDPDYAGKIVDRANQIGATDTANGGTMSIPKPPVLTAPRSPNYGYNAPRDVQLVCLHITEGSGGSALSWLCNPDSGASSNYLIMEDGTIHELVPPDQSAWANGAVNNPDMGNPIIAECINSGRNPNTISVSIEHAGYSSWGGGGSLTAVQWGMSAWLTAWLCQEYLLPPDDVSIIGHYQIDSVNRSGCPGFSHKEWDRYYAVVDHVVRQEGDDVKLPPEGTAVQFIAPNGNTVSVINWGGVATQIKGVNYADLGAHVVGEDGETEYNRSLQQGIMGPFVVVEDAEEG